MLQQNSSWRDTKAAYIYTEHIQPHLHSCIFSCLDVADEFGYAIKACKLIAQQNNSPSLIPV